jgi:aryl sulfotransferase
MPRIFWLASYPKSGNTWMRAFLTNYQHDSDTPADINRMDGGPIASARVWFDEWVGIEASILSDAVIERLRPEVYRCLARESQETLYMKVHDAWGKTDCGEAMFPADVTAGVIYILRNPLDVVGSFANHYGVTFEKAVASMLDEDFGLSRSLGGLSDQLRQYLGSWEHHVRSWVNESHLPVLVVRYEDLRQTPEAAFGEVVHFCGLPFDARRLQKAIAFSDFNELRRQENEKGFRERLTQATQPFFRKGQAGAWQEELAPDLVKRIRDGCCELMQRFGYW